jgi:cytochrome c peroxidase
MNSSIRLFLILTSILFCCSAVYKIVEKPYEFVVPEGFPKPYIPEDNALTYERIELGKKLFYDTILSSDRSVSCASCHVQTLGFTDGKTLSTGVKHALSDRNGMPLINLAWSNSFFWDGGVTSLELQVMKPLTSVNEMNMPVQEAINRLNADKTYKKLFKKAYGTDPDASSLFRAIAAFERTLVSANTKFDAYFYKKDPTAFDESELRGYKLFFGGDKVHCGSCHSGVNLTNNTFQNNGLYMEYADQGRYKITGKESDKGKFKVPTLRNIALTSPYMHDGSLKTLEEVIDHYNTGGIPHLNKSEHVHIHKGMKLNAQDKKDLIRFLHTLTDIDFITNKNFRPE